mmetsp:Transcript_31956/g.101784  ORF Transcript_31956/g.101784 Transcript_31956/m.101784 type:complete len:206 (-) Transcript_31956:83-700(-)
MPGPAPRRGRPPLPWAEARACAAEKEGGAPRTVLYPPCCGQRGWSVPGLGRRGGGGIRGDVTRRGNLRGHPPRRAARGGCGGRGALTPRRNQQGPAARRVEGGAAGGGGGRGGRAERQQEGRGRALEVQGGNRNCSGERLRGPPGSGGRGSDGGYRGAARFQGVRGGGRLPDAGASGRGAGRRGSAARRGGAGGGVVAIRPRAEG